jgi:hypothetical protein
LLQYGSTQAEYLPVRGTRAIAIALAVFSLGACGTASTRALSPIFPAGPSGTRAPAQAPVPPAAAVTVHLGTDERLAPVERLLSAVKGKFDAALFLSAFDDNAQACDITRIAQGFNGKPAQPPVHIATTRVLGFGSSGDIGSVELRDVTPLYVLLRRVGGKWIIDENACLWMSEVDGDNFPNLSTSGLTELTASDPRRAPAAALLTALIHKFDARTFVGAFDLADQPCDVPALARSASTQTTADLPSVTPAFHFFVRPTGSGQAGVLADAGAGVLPVRIRKVNGRWLLAENACSWLSILVGAHVRGEDRGVQSDLRNGLVAEKTGYTDTQTYSSSVSDMKAIEPSLDWGNRLRVFVGDVATPGDKNVVCLSEASPSGRLWAIADIAAGPKAGAYYGAKGCPSPLTADAVARLGTSFDAPG